MIKKILGICALSFGLLFATATATMAVIVTIKATPEDPSSALVTIFATPAFGTGLMAMAGISALCFVAWLCLEGEDSGQ